MSHLGQEQISRTQFGFINAVKTRETIFSIQVLFQKRRFYKNLEYQKDADDMI